MSIPPGLKKGHDFRKRSGKNETLQAVVAGDRLLVGLLSAPPMLPLGSPPTSLREGATAYIPTALKGRKRGPWIVALSQRFGIRVLFFSPGLADYNV